MDAKEFLNFIRGVRSKLNMQDFLQKLIITLGIGACMGIILQVIAFIVPFYYANLYTAAVILLAILGAVVAARLRRRTMEQAALAIDRFGFEERIITAYENLKAEDGQELSRNMNMVLAQRQDAFRRLKAQKDRIRIRVLPSWKQILGAVLLLIIMSGLTLFPAKTKLLAQEQHLIKKEAEEKKEEILEVTKETAVF